MNSLESTSIPQGGSEAEVAFKLHESIVGLKRSVQQNTLQMGATLKELRDRKLYRLLDYPSFQAYCASPEVSVKRSTAYAFIRVYEVFIERFKYPVKQLETVDSKKLERILPVVDEENHQEWLEKARELSYTDLVTEIRQRNLDPANCQHDWEEQVIYYCKQCHERTKHLTPGEHAQRVVKRLPRYS